MKHIYLFSLMLIFFSAISGYYLPLENQYLFGKPVKPVSHERDSLNKKKIISYFDKKNITYRARVKSLDPFLDREKCGKYDLYTITEIRFIRFARGRYYYRVYCTGYDKCKKTAVKETYSVVVDKNYGISVKKETR